MDNYIEDILKEKGFINGVYTPWFHKAWFGFDIGKSVYDGYKKCFFDEAYVKSVLQNCKAMGFDMLKIWLNESFEGMLFDENGSVTGVEPTFAKNLRKLLDMSAELGLSYSLCINAHQEMYYHDEKHLYDKYMRFVYIEEETEKYIKNWLVPILQIAKESGCVPLIDLYAEPEADGGGWKVSRGFSWNTMVRYIKLLNKAVKDFDPRLATTVSSGAVTSTLIQGRYNNIDVDYYGADIYSDGNFDSTKKMLLSKPFMLGEYGVANYATATDDEQTDVVKRFLYNAEKNNVKAAFYWCYGWKCDSADEMHLLDSKGEFRKVASYFHFTQLDREYKRKNISTYDKPEFLAIVSPKKLRFFGTRGAESYVLERKDDNTYEEIAVFSAENNAEYPLIVRYSDKNGKQDSVYRIKAIMPDGTEVCSDEATVIRKEGK